MKSSKVSFGLVSFYPQRFQCPLLSPTRKRFLKISIYHVLYCIERVVIAAPPGGLVLRIFTSWKNPSTSARFEPVNLGSRGEHITSRPLRPLFIVYYCYFCSVHEIFKNVCWVSIIISSMILVSTTVTNEEEIFENIYIPCIVLYWKGGHCCQCIATFSRCILLPRIEVLLAREYTD